MTFHLNSPLGGGATFRNWVGSAVRGERELGFFRLTLTVDFIVEPAGSAGGGQPDLLWRTSCGKLCRTRAAAPNSDRAEIAAWISDLVAERQAFRERLEERQRL